jgi:hypothetical protein
VIAGRNSVLDGVRIVDNIEGFDQRRHCFNLLAVETIAFNKQMFLVDRQIVQRDREFPLRRDRRQAVLPVDDRCYLAIVIDNYVLKTHITVIERSFVAHRS